MSGAGSFGLWVDLRALLLIIVANSTPLVLAWLSPHSAAWPIDCGHRLSDGRPLFGPHKTWRGFIAAVLMSAAVGVAVSLGWAIGAVFGVLALSGDLLSSFLKRRLNCPSGRWVPLLDQLPEALLPLLVLRSQLSLSAGSMLATALVFTLLDMIVSKLLAEHRRYAGWLHGRASTRGSDRR
jgi:CDP-2,3-bis-(O-geranylgeranyl)-sn-glycerol synthase